MNNSLSDLLYEPTETESLIYLEMIVYLQSNDGGDDYDEPRRRRTFEEIC